MLYGRLSGAAVLGVLLALPGGLSGCAPHSRSLSGKTVKPPRVEAPKATASLPGTPGERLNRIIEHGYALVGGNNRKAITAKWGPPASVKSDQVRNRHNPKLMDTYYTLQYPGISFIIYHVSESNRELLDLLIIDKPRDGLPFGVNVGMSADEVVRILGQPDEQRQDSYYYWTDTPNTPTLIFSFAERTVREITWGFYVD